MSVTGATHFLFLHKLYLGWGFLAHNGKLPICYKALQELHDGSSFLGQGSFREASGGEVKGLLRAEWGEWRI